MAVENESRYTWLEFAFAISSAVLVFQLFPDVFWAGLAHLDVRQWTWRSYGVVSGVAIVVLFVAKTWQDSAWQSR
jgi:hypothetical protein